MGNFRVAISRESLQQFRSQISAVRHFHELPHESFRRNLTASYIAPFIAIAILAVVVLWRIQKQIAVTDRVEQSDQIILAANGADLTFRDLQSDLRNYLIAPDKKYPSELDHRQKTLAVTLGRLISLVRDSPAEEQYLVRVSDLKGQWLKEAETLMRQPDRSIAAGHGVAEARTTANAVVNSLDDLQLLNIAFVGLASVAKRERISLLLRWYPSCVF